MSCTEPPAPAAQHLRNAVIDEHELLDEDQRAMLKVMRNARRSKRQQPITMLGFAQIALRATASNLAEAPTLGDGMTTQEMDAWIVADRDLRRAAVLYVYEALLASDDALIRSELDPALRTLLVLVRDLPAIEVEPE